MKMSDKGLTELVGHEGICTSKYLDSVGVWTIGIGATKSELPVMPNSITIPQAFELLRTGIVKYEDALNRALIHPVKQTQFDALCSWCYNVGTGWVRKATIVKRINAGDTGQDLYDALMMFDIPKEIIPRRRKEALLLRDGIYSNKGEALLFPVNTKHYPVYSKGTTINVWEYLPAKETPVLPIEVAASGVIQRVKDYFWGTKS